MLAFPTVQLCANCTEALKGAARSCHVQGSSIRQAIPTLAYAVPTARLRSTQYRSCQGLRRLGE
eukprot:1517649-Pyramimonas_sp.AAC.1